ncbi:MAG: acetyl-CoA C-acyltransferase, partial [Actinobacteria bacterium]|nr:acetyl-CoA C-acyltransferase [Actinomycetota bacterium]
MTKSATAKTNVVLVDAVRTPFGKAGSLYAETRADDIMVRCIRGLLERNPNLPVDQIDDVAIAAATQTGDQGMNIGRSVSILAGIPKSVPGYSIDRWCAGALTAVTTIAGGINMGAYDLAIAGGVEHMGHHPMGDGMDPNPRYLAEKLVDTDALQMGATAERLHDKFPHLTKERADKYALASQQKTAAAYAANKIQPDLIPVATRTAELGWGMATVDEPPRPQTTLEALAALKTPFRAAGRVTAGNAAGLNDGATAAILASESKAKELNLPIKAKMVSFAFAGVEPEIMGYGPVPSTIKALKKAGLDITDIGLFEVNEAFAIQVLSFLDHFGIADDDKRVNIYGGAIAVGHPLASSGVRLILNLANGFKEQPEVRYGITTMCIGLGMGGTI